MRAVPLPNPSPARPYTDATRVMSSVLASSEKRTLLWIAPRLPRWMNSDHLTALALLAMLGAGLSVLAGPRAPGRARAGRRLSRRQLVW